MKARLCVAQRALAMVLIFWGVSSSAQAGWWEDFQSGLYDFSEPRIVMALSEEYDSVVLSECSVQRPKAEPTLTAAAISISEIINIGKEIWAIIEAGEPVIDVRTAKAHALPRGISCWNELEGWRVPKSTVYQVVYENAYGWDVVNFRYRVIATSGGSYQGKGKYLTNVTVIPESLDVLWGYDFSADVSIATPINLNTAEDPIAGLELTVQWHVETILKKSRESRTYFLTGQD